MSINKKYIEESIKKEKAIPFILFDSESKLFKLTQEGINVIQSIKEPFSIVSIAGMYRTGKSYLINKVLLDKSNSEEGFIVGSTVNACTKGLWIWPSPINLSNKCKTFLIDTEGFGAYDEDQNHDYKIFILALLVSSMFIYNSIGTIDETAIQSLSFVVNLSKKLNQMNKSNQVTNYFPDLIWVVRDFGLQLINENGDTISSNDYLELALKSQSTDKDDIKNSVRATIKTYFKNRECFTMVRPVTDENKLQNIIQLKDIELRSEFLEQVMSLRKKILTSCKPKQISGISLNGELYCEMINDYIQAINNDEIPKVEDLFSSVCFSESLKSYERSIALYENNMKTSLSNEKELSKPFSSIHSTNFLKSFKSFIDSINNLLEIKVNLEDFKENQDFYPIPIISNKKINEILNKLLNEISEKKQVFKNDYESKARNSIFKILHKAYNDSELLYIKIENDDKVKNKIDLILNEIEKIRLHLESLFPNLSMTLEMYNDFKSNVILMILNKMTNKAKEEKIKFENESNLKINQIKANNDLEINKLKNELILNNDNLSLFKNNIKEMKEELNNKEIKLSEYKNKINELENQHNEKIMLLKDDYNKKLNDLSLKIDFSNEKSSMAERSKITLQAEFEKEKALLNQTINHYSKIIEEHKKEDKSNNKELTSQIKEKESALKDIKQKKEQVEVDLTAKINLLQEEVLDLKSQLSSINLESEEVKKKNNEQERELRNNKKNYENQLKELEKLLKEEKANLKEKTKEMKLIYEQEANKNQTEFKQEKDSLYVLNNNQKEELSKAHNEISLLKQKIDFMNNTIYQLNEKIESNLKSNEILQKKLELSSNKIISNEEMNNKINQIEDFYKDDRNKLTSSHEKLVTSLNNKIEQLNELLNKEIKLSELEKGDLFKENKEQKIKIEALQSDIISLERKKKDLESNLNNSQEESIYKTQQLTKDYEYRLDQLKTNNIKEISELNGNSEDQVKKLRSMFDYEKLKLEEKIKTDKINNEKKLKNTIEDYENKLNDMENDYKNEIENLQYELNNLRKEFEDYIYRAEKEVDLLKQNKETLEGLWEASKQALVKNQLQFKQSFENQLDSSSKERSEMLKRIESLTSQLASLDKEHMLLKLRKEQCDKDIESLKEQLTQARITLEKEKSELQNLMNSLTNKLNDITEEFTIKKLEFTRESALLKQQIEFLNNKIEELKEVNETNQLKYEEKLFTLKSNIEGECNERIDKVEKQKIELENKLMLSKKDLREVEQTFYKQISILEKEKALVEERLDKSEIKIREITDNYQKEIEQMISFQKNLKDNYQKELDDFQNSNEFLKNKINSLETEITEKSNVFSKDKALLESRCAFLEAQRDKYKTENFETIKSFENNLESFQDKTQKEIERIKSQYENQNAANESKYKKQIADLQESHKNMYVDLVTLNKELERELKSLQLQSEINQRKGNDPNIIAQKVQELLNIQESMKEEMDHQRHDKENRIRDIIEQADAEKDQLFQRINFLESKLKESENKKSNTILEFERLSASWNIEKSQLYSKISELDENRQRLEDKIELLIKENEKFKVMKAYTQGQGQGQQSNQQPKLNYTGSGNPYAVYTTQKIVSNNRPNNQSYNYNQQNSTNREKVNISNISNTKKIYQHPKISNNPDYSNIEPDDIDDRFLDKHILDSSFSSNNSLKFENLNMKNPNHSIAYNQNNISKQQKRFDDGNYSQQNNVNNSGVYYKKPSNK